jgi:hypothetical protein
MNISQHAIWIYYRKQKINKETHHGVGDINKTCKKNVINLLVKTETFLHGSGTEMFS